MKTGDLIFWIFLGAIFCFVVAVFPLAVPYYYFLPPINSYEKNEVATLKLQKFSHEFSHILSSNKHKNADIDKILSELIASKKDSWGNTFWYSVQTNKYSKEIFSVCSSGPDGKQRTTDDLKRKIFY